jgi:hypothetical protein
LTKFGYIDSILAVAFRALEPYFKTWSSQGKKTEHVTTVLDVLQIYLRQQLEMIIDFTSYLNKEMI